MNLTLGILAATGKEPVSIALVDQKSNVNNAGTYTFSGVNFGAAAVDRLIAVWFTSATGSNPPFVTSMTIAGQPATLMSAMGAGDDNLSGRLGVVIIPAGTSGTVVVNVAPTGGNGCISVFSIIGAENSAPTEVFGQALSGSNTKSAVVPDKSAGIGVWVSNQTGVNRCSFSGTVLPVETSDLNPEPGSVPSHATCTFSVSGNLTCTQSSTSRCWLGTYVFHPPV